MKLSKKKPSATGNVVRRANCPAIDLGNVQSSFDPPFADRIQGRLSDFLRPDGHHLVPAMPNARQDGSQAEMVVGPPSSRTTAPPLSAKFPRNDRQRARRVRVAGHRHPKMHRKFAASHPARQWTRFLGVSRLLECSEETPPSETVHLFAIAHRLRHASDCAIVGTALPAADVSRLAAVGHGRLACREHGGRLDLVPPVHVA
jgi:hypothetical protein